MFWQRPWTRRTVVVILKTAGNGRAKTPLRRSPSPGVSPADPNLGTTKKHNPMKAKPTLRHFLAAIGCATLAISSASAQTDGTWVQPDAGTYDWSVTDNWLDGTVAGGTDATASFTEDSAGAQTAALDTAVTLGNLTLNRNQDLTIAGPEALTLDVTSGTPILDVNSGRTLNMNAELAGSDGIQLQGGGTLNVFGNVTLTGGVTIIGSTLAVVPTGTFNAGALPIANGAISLSEGGHLMLRGNNTSAGQFSVGNGGGMIQNRGNNTFTTTGILTGSGTLTFTDAGGAGNRTFNFNSTSNDFTGGFVVSNANGHVIQVNSLPDIANNIAFNRAGGGSGNATFRYGAGADAALTLNNRVFELNGGDTLTGAIENLNTTHAITVNTNLIATGAGAKTFSLRGNAGPTNVFAGLIADETDEGEGTVALTKLGASTWVLGGDNTYTGSTTISAGRLVVNGDQSAATGPVAVDGSSTLGGSGTLGGDVIVAATANLAPGASVGTLSIVGDLNISAMADGAGKLFHELGPIAASDKIAVSGALEIGTDVLGFSDFDFTNVGGLEEGVYTLITSNGLSGTLDGANLSGTIGTFEATLQISGNNIELAVAGPPPTTTLVIDLGAGTEIPGGAFGTFGAGNLPIPPLPAGSILRSVEVDAVLEATDNENLASDLAVLFDPTPETPGDDFSVVMTNGPINFGAAVQLGWPAAANSGPPTPLVDTKVAADWAAAGTIDLATTGIFLGNAFNNNIGSPDEGGTWSGTITLTYDIAATGTPFELWAGSGVDFDGDENGDGVSNGLAFLLGAGGPNDNALDLLPTATETGGGLVMTFNMLDAASRGAATLSIEHSSDLGITDAWTTVAVPDSNSGPTDGVSFTVTGSGTLNIEATISSSEAAAGKLFGRLKAENN